MLVLRSLPQPRGVLGNRGSLLIWPFPSLLFLLLFSVCISISGFNLEFLLSCHFMNHKVGGGIDFVLSFETV